MYLFIYRIFVNYSFHKFYITIYSYPRGKFFANATTFDLRAIRNVTHWFPLTSIFSRVNIVISTLQILIRFLLVHIRPCKFLGMIKHSKNPNWINMKLRSFWSVRMLFIRETKAWEKLRMFRIAAAKMICRGKLAATTLLSRANESHIQYLLMFSIYKIVIKTNIYI